MFVSFRALDVVNYDTLQCAGQTSQILQEIKTQNDKKEVFATYKAIGIPSLEELSAARLVDNHCQSFLSETVDNTPPHLLNTLLRASLLYDRYLASVVIISEWPLESLVLQDVYPEGREHLFNTLYQFDSHLFLSLVRRNQVRGKSKLKRLDLRGFKLNTEFRRLLVGALPFLSLRYDQRDADRLTQDLIASMSQVGTQQREFENSGSLLNPVANDLRPIIAQKIEQYNTTYFYVPDGERFRIQVDSLQFTRENMAHMFDYMIMGGLRERVACVIETQNLYIETSIEENERVIDSCAPFLALLGQDPQVLRGLSLNNMEDMLFQYILGGVHRFTQLRALDIGNCSISVAGKTRCRNALRDRIVGLFTSFTHLTRLDLTGSELLGHLGTLLDALSTPLNYLNVTSCMLKDDDLLYLPKSKHATSLVELHLSSIVNKGEIKTVQPVLECLPGVVPNLIVLGIQGNEIDDTSVAPLCEVLSHAARLRILDTLYNYMTEAGILALVHGACVCLRLEIMAVNMLPFQGPHSEEVTQQRMDLQQKSSKVLERNGRLDITLVVVAIGMTESDDEEEEEQ